MVLRTDTVEKNLALDGGAGDDFVHAVDGAQHGGFTAAGRADERGDRLGGDLHVDVLYGVEVAVVDVDVVEFELGGHL